MATTIYCQFSDASEKSISVIFGGAQDPDDYPNQGSIPSDDERYSAYFGSLGPSVQEYMVKPGE